MMITAKLKERIKGKEIRRSGYKNCFSTINPGRVFQKIINFV